MQIYELFRISVTFFYRPIKARGLRVGAAAAGGWGAGEGGRRRRGGGAGGWPREGAAGTAGGQSLVRGRKPAAPTAPRARRPSAPPPRRRRPRAWKGAAAARGGVRGHVSRGTSLQRAHFQHVAAHHNRLGYCKRTEIAPAILCWGHGYAVTDVNTWLQM